MELLNADKAPRFKGHKETQIKQQCNKLTKHISNGQQQQCCLMTLIFG